MLVVVTGWLWYQDGCGVRMVVVTGWLWWQDGCGGRMVLVTGWLWWQDGCGDRIVMVTGWLWWQDGCGNRMVVVTGWLWCRRGVRTGGTSGGTSARTLSTIPGRLLVTVLKVSFTQHHSLFYKRTVSRRIVCELTTMQANYNDPGVIYCCHCASQICISLFSGIKYIFALKI